MALPVDVNDPGLVNVENQSFPPVPRDTLPIEPASASNNNVGQSVEFLPGIGVSRNVFPS
jgi:hypothetical protein